MLGNEAVSNFCYHIYYFPNPLSINLRQLLDCLFFYINLSLVFSSVAPSCPTLSDPIDCSMPDLPVYHQLSEFTQTHVHWVSDTIQPSHPLVSPSPPAFNLSQHQKWSHSVVSDSLQPRGLQHARLPVHNQLPELTQTHVHWVSDTIQPSHPLSTPSPPAFNLSQHQGLFEWSSSSHQVAKVLKFQLQHQSFQWIFRTDFIWQQNLT